MSAQNHGALPRIAGALYAFAGWLTCRPERLVCSSSDDAGPAAQAVADFLKMAGVDAEPQVNGWRDEPATAAFALKLDMADLQDAIAPLQAQADALVAEYAQAERELDTLLNTVPTGRSLAQLVEQVRVRQGVQVLNLTDGMRVNFRAPDGRRATLHLDVLLDYLGDDPRHFEWGVPATIRAAISGYPLAGGPLPVLDELDDAQQDAAQVQALASSRVHPDSALPPIPRAPAPGDLHGTMDAKLWADAFCRLNCAADHGTMHTWFANAIMTGWDFAKRDTPDLYGVLRAMYWNDGKLAVIKARDLALGVQTYSGEMLDKVLQQYAEGRP